MDDSNDISSAGKDRRLHSVDSSLTERQRTILNVIRASVSSRGYPPSIREIGDAVGYFIGAAAAGVLYFAEKYGSKLLGGK